MTQMNAGKWVRKRLLDRALADLPEATVIQIIEKMYNNRSELARLRGLLISPGQDRELDGKIYLARGDMFIEAIILVSYGRLDLMDDLLALFEYQISPIWREGTIISRVVPLPYLLDGVENVAKNLA